MPDVEKAAADADIVLHLTEWRQYQEIDPVALRAIVRRPVLIDARNALPHRLWRESGWTVRCLGTGHDLAAAGGVPQRSDQQEDTCESWLPEAPAFSARICAMP
jgi:hypothetical protein